MLKRFLVITFDVNVIKQSFTKKAPIRHEKCSYCKIGVSVDSQLNESKHQEMGYDYKQNKENKWKK